MMRMGELIRLSQENQVLRKKQAIRTNKQWTGYLRLQSGCDQDKSTVDRLSEMTVRMRQDVLTGFDRVFEFGRAELSAKLGRPDKFMRE